MKDAELLARITVNPKVMVGKPVVKGTRLPVDLILNLLAHHATIEDILREYDRLAPDDIYACLLFAARSFSPASNMPMDDSNTLHEELA